MVPSVSRVAVLANPASIPTAGRLKALEGAARALRVKVHVVEARERQGIDAAFAAITRERAEALFVLNDPMFGSQRERIVDLAAKHRLPGTSAANTLKLGASELQHERATAPAPGHYGDKILKGAGRRTTHRPLQSSRCLNLKTARHRLTCSSHLLRRPGNL